MASSPQIADEANPIAMGLFTGVKRLDPRAEPALAGVERFGHEAFVAFTRDGVTVGIARYLRSRKPVSAEVTVAVSEAWRERGLASLLLHRVAARARSVGIEQLTASCCCLRRRADPPAEPARSDGGRSVRRRAGGDPDRSQQRASRAVLAGVGERRPVRLSEGRAMPHERSSVLTLPSLRGGPQPGTGRPSRRTRLDRGQEMF